jgi:hypothetical protein
MLKILDLLKYKDVIAGAAIATGVVGLTVVGASMAGAARGKQKAKKEANAQVPPKTVADTDVDAK